MDDPLNLRETLLLAINSNLYKVVEWILSTFEVNDDIRKEMVDDNHLCIKWEHVSIEMLEVYRRHQILTPENVYRLASNLVYSSRWDLFPWINHISNVSIDIFDAIFICTAVNDDTEIVQELIKYMETSDIIIKQAISWRAERTTDNESMYNILTQVLKDDDKNDYLTQPAL